MAGPGGGPPRRSHTKSRKGCETCKRRHIRCDETFPQCRNCTKHKIRCPYNDAPVPENRSVSPDRPELMWTPEIEADISRWQKTGVFPFPGLNVYPEPNPQQLSVESLRLIHHVASISHQLRSIDADGFSIWTRQIPTIIQIGAAHGYVMHALLAFSASHIAYLNECPIVGIMADEHRGIALKGLQEAISTFSRDTSDAILAASLVLSWQATDWRSWTQLMQGTRSVIEAMDPWKHESQFGDFIAESSTFPTAPPSPAPDHKPSQPAKADLEVFQRTIQQLQKVETFLKHSKQDFQAVAQLITFLKGARKESNTPVAQQFARLRPLRDWLFWTPVRFFQTTGGSPAALVSIAHLYTVALVMERLFPEIGAAYFGSLSIGPVEEIARRLLSINVTGGALDGCDDVQTPLTLMEFPIDVVHEFRARMGWVNPVRTRSFPQFDPPNFYLQQQQQHHQHQHHDSVVVGGSTVSLPSIVDYRQSSPIVDYRQQSPLVDYRQASPVVDYQTGSPLVDYRQQSPIVDYRQQSPIVDYRQASPIIDFQTQQQQQQQQQPPPPHQQPHHLSPYVQPVVAANPAFSYSTEDLSMLPAGAGGEQQQQPEATAGSSNNNNNGNSHNSGSNNNNNNPAAAISPLQLSSPYANPQYLSIPSPSYGGYSPASSSFGDFGDGSSVGYSDNEDFGSYEMAYGTATGAGGPGSGPAAAGIDHTHMLGAPNNFGVGLQQASSSYSSPHLPLVVAGRHSPYPAPPEVPSHLLLPSSIPSSSASAAFPSVPAVPLLYHFQHPHHRHNLSASSSAPPSILLDECKDMDMEEAAGPGEGSSHVNSFVS